MLELSFDVKPDKEGMVNGLDLAANLIALAARLINPYVKECPACLDDVFSYIANAELEKLHDLVKTGQANTSVLYCMASPDRKEDVVRKALETAQPTIEAMIMKQTGQAHTHH